MTDILGQNIKSKRDPLQTHSLKNKTKQANIDRKKIYSIVKSDIDTVLGKGKGKNLFKNCTKHNSHGEV